MEYFVICFPSYAIKSKATRWQAYLELFIDHLEIILGIHVSEMEINTL